MVSRCTCHGGCERRAVQAPAEAKPEPEFEDALEDPAPAATKESSRFAYQTLVQEPEAASAPSRGKDGHLTLASMGMGGAAGSSGNGARLRRLLSRTCACHESFGLHDGGQVNLCRLKQHGASDTSSCVCALCCSNPELVTHHHPCIGCAASQGISLAVAATPNHLAMCALCRHRMRRRPAQQSPWI